MGQTDRQKTWTLRDLEAAHADEAGAEVQARAWDQLVALTEAYNATSEGGAV